ncbi:MAG: helix-turn-helix transcriptional regulator [Bacillota bacterium]
MDKSALDFLKRLSAAIAAQFGNTCEVVVHDLSGKEMEHTVVAIENGHVTNRKVGDGPSHIVLESIRGDAQTLKDQFNYLTKTGDGRILKSSTVYIRDGENGKPVGIFSINQDITNFMLVHSALESMLSLEKGENKQIERIPQNVTELLDDLIEESTALIGKPVPMMSKDDKIRAIQYLNRAGAFLITKSGDKVAKHFGISKYTLYSYMDMKEKE